MRMGRQVASALYVIGGVAVGWVLFQWLSPDRSDAVAAQPTGVEVPAPTVIVVPVTVPVGTAGDGGQTGNGNGNGNGGAGSGGTGSQGARRPASGTFRGVPASQSVPIPGGQLIIAQDGSIIVVGDDAILTANTGATSTSAAVVLNSRDSQVTSGTSTTGGPAASGIEARGPAAAEPSGAPDPGAPTAATAATVSGQTRGTSPTGGDIASSDSALNAMSNALALQFSGRPVAIAGYEDHSVAVYGNDQIVTYDDSNVFIDRQGQINANTGDTDSSGLNAVDVADSVVRSGDHTEDGEDDGDEDGEEEEEPEEDLVAPRSAPLPGGAPAANTVRRASSPNGTDHATSTDPDASTAATGRNPLAIGADGYDDVSIRSTGNRNIITYDDSNVVIGGAGAINAQIGDSDTSGAVVMGVRGSDIASGAST